MQIYRPIAACFRMDNCEEYQTGKHIIIKEQKCIVYHNSFTSQVCHQKKKGKRNINKKLAPTEEQLKNV